MRGPLTGGLTNPYDTLHIDAHSAGSSCSVRSRNNTIYYNALEII